MLAWIREQGDVLAREPTNDFILLQTFRKPYNSWARSLYLFHGYKLFLIRRTMLHTESLGRNFSFLGTSGRSNHLEVSPVHGDQNVMIAGDRGMIIRAIWERWVGSMDISRRHADGTMGILLQWWTRDSMCKRADRLKYN